MKAKLKLGQILKQVPDIIIGHKVIVSRADLGKAWKEQVRPHALESDPDISGVCYDSAFNDFCKQLGLKEGK